MKISIVHSVYQSAASGENEAVESQAAALRLRGHQVQTLLRSVPSPNPERHYLFSTGLRVATGYGSSPLAQINSFGPDVVHLHNLTPNWGTRWLSKLQIPVVATVHNFRYLCAAGTFSRESQTCFKCQSESSLNSIRYACYRGSAMATVPLAIATSKPRSNPVLRVSSQLIFVHENTKKIYERFLGDDIALKARIISNFVESLPMKPSPDARRDTWVYAGRLSPEKGILELIRNWPPSRKLLIFGDGPLRRICEVEAENKPIQFLGARSSSEVRKTLAFSRGLVMPSTCFEAGFPTSYLHALACGVPTVAHAKNTAGQDVIRHTTGSTFEDFSGLTVALSRAENDWNRIIPRIMVRTADFTPSVWGDLIEDVYRQVVST